MAAKTKSEKIQLIPLSSIDPPMEASRVEIDPEYILELTGSIKERGQLSPARLAIRGSRYQVIFGDRRRLACIAAGLQYLKAVVVQANDSDILLDRAIENIQRVDLSPFEEAKEYFRLIEKLEVPVEKIAKIIGKSPGSVKRSLEILKMPEYLQKALHRKLISKAVAEELDACPDEAHKQYLTEMAVEHGVTKMIVRNWVNDYKKSLRGAVDAGGGGSSLSFTPKSEPVYVTCFLCKGAVDVLKAVNVTVCPGCKKDLSKILEGND